MEVPCGSASSAQLSLYSHDLDFLVPSRSAPSFFDDIVFLFQSSPLLPHQPLFPVPHTQLF